MKTTTYETLLLILAISMICVMDCLATSLYWQHQSIVHHAAFFEASSWGNVSFHWNDDSYAHTPFDESNTYEKIQAQIFQKKLDALNK